MLVTELRDGAAPLLHTIMSCRAPHPAADGAGSNRAEAEAEASLLLSKCPGARPVPPSSVLPPALRVPTRLLRPLAARSCHHWPATIISRESLSGRDHSARSCATTRAAPPLSSAPPPSFHSQWRLLHVWCRHGRRVRNAAGRACCQQTQNGDRLCLLLAL